MAIALTQQKAAVAAITHTLVASYVLTGVAPAGTVIPDELADRFAPTLRVVLLDGSKSGGVFTAVAIREQVFTGQAVADFFAATNQVNGLRRKLEDFVAANGGTASGGSSIAD